MGYGDEVMATGLVKGAAASGKLIAFGDGQNLIWGPHFEEVFRYNPNVARKTGLPNIEWSRYGKGRRPTFKRTERDRYVWDYDFKVKPGEFFFSEQEEKFGAVYRGGILIEPNVVWNKSVAVNKDWGMEKYQELCDYLSNLGHDVWQTSFGRNRLKGAKVVQIPSYRCMASALRSFNFIVCPEGGMSHAAGAVGAKAIVIFGGYPAIPVVGYDFHKNISGGVEACGKFVRCAHCADAMKRITVDEVIDACEDMFI